jgi:CRISPR-associated protein Cas2
MMIVEKVPTSLKGALSRWLLEPKTGIFLGDPSARVRDELWKQAMTKTKGGGSIIQIWTDDNPQGFSYRQYGVQERSFIDVEGMSLIQRKRKLASTEPVAINNENPDTEED